MIMKLQIEKIYTFQAFVLIIGVLLTPFLCINSDIYLYTPPKEVFLKIIVFFLVTSFLVILFKKKSIQFNISNFDIFVVLIYFTIIMSILFSGNRINNTEIVKLTYLSIFFFLSKGIIKRSIDYNLIYTVYLILFVILIVCVFESIICFLQYFNIIEYHGPIVYESVIFGTLGHPNQIGSFFSISIVLLAGLYLISKHNILKAISLCVIVISLIIVVLTKSRGSWLGLISGLIFLFYDNIIGYWKNIKSYVAKILIIVALFALISFLVIYLFNFNKASSIGRIFIWKVTWEMVKSHPLEGIGYGNYQMEFPAYQKIFLSQHPEFYNFAGNVFDSHNQFLQTLAENGIIGLVIFCSFWCFIFYSFFVYKEKQKMIYQIFISSLVVIFVHSFFDCNLNFFVTNFLFYLIIGILSVLFLANNCQKIDLTLRIPKLKLSYKFALLFLYVYLFSFTLVNIIHECAGYYYWQKSKHLRTRFEWGKSITYLKKAEKMLPNNQSLNFELGIAYVYKNEYKSALDEFNKAEKTIRLKDLSLYKAQAYENTKEYAKAMMYYQDIILTYPNLLYPKYRLGLLYLKLKDKEKAKDMFNNVINSKVKIKNNEALAIKKLANEQMNLLNKQ